MRGVTVAGGATERRDGAARLSGELEHAPDAPMQGAA
jgi:hypothetical protein